MSSIVLSLLITTTVKLQPSTQGKVNLMITHFSKRTGIASLMALSFFIAQPITVNAYQQDYHYRSYDRNRNIDRLGQMITVSIILGICYLVSHFQINAQKQQAIETEHRLLNEKRKEYFLDKIHKKLNGPDFKTAERTILTNHSQYRYPNYVDAMKETCPGYPEYIKTLLVDLNRHPHHRTVEGFKTLQKGSLLFSSRANDFYEFYELVKTLDKEVRIQEQQAAKAAAFQEELVSTTTA